MVTFFDYSLKEKQNYYTQQYNASAPNKENKTSYTVKKGDNLWNIAKKQLNKKKATNAEISNMMYAIAKLNNKQTIDAANNLEINDVIYLPTTGNIKKSSELAKQPKDQKIATQHKISKNPKQQVLETAEKIKDIVYPQDPHATYTQKQLYKSKHINDIDNKLYAQFGEDGANYWTETLNKDNGKLIIEHSYSYKPTPTGLIITKKQNDKRYGDTEAHLLVQTDDNGKVEKVSYNSPGVSIYSTRFDFELDKNGNLKRPDFLGHYKTIKKLDKEEYQNFINELQKQVDQNLNK